MEIVSENLTGLESKITFHCKMCKAKFIVKCDDAVVQMNINTCAVAGSIATGAGHAQFNEIVATIGLPIMTRNTFKKNMDVINEVWDTEKTNSMIECAQIERHLAIEEERVNEEGIPIIDVFADGCWGKRPYQKNYSSLSGGAAIIYLFLLNKSFMYFKSIE
jgi:hypothetical protein